MADSDPLDQVEYIKPLPIHTLEVFRATDGEWYWRKFAIATGDNVGHDGEFSTMLRAMREAAVANPEIEVITVNVGSLYTKAQLERIRKNREQLEVVFRGERNRVK